MYFFQHRPFCCFILGFSRNGNFFAQHLHNFTLQNNFEKLCASFAHEAEPLLRNIPHWSTSHATNFVHICTKIKIAQNYLRNLLKNQNCAELFAQKAKFRKILNVKNKIAQKATFFKKLNPYPKIIISYL